MIIINASSASRALSNVWQQPNHGYEVKFILFSRDLANARISQEFHQDQASGVRQPRGVGRSDRHQAGFSSSAEGGFFRPGRHPADKESQP
jgi:hypothetical protein